MKVRPRNRQAIYLGVVQLSYDDGDFSPDDLV
jgi:hypothetical protein